MRRRKQSFMDSKNLAIIVAVLCVIMMIVSFKFGNQISPVKTAMGTVFSPMQNGINIVGSTLFDKVNIFADVRKLRDENKELKEELDALKGQNKLLLQEQDELEALRDFYELSDNYSDLKTVAARVTSKDPTNWYSSFTIDKGTNDGIEVNMNVIANDGLVGIVSEVGHNYAKIRTIMDDKSNVTGVFLKSTATCNVAGDLKLAQTGLATVESIAKDVDVKDGDAVYTAYLSPKFHSGILIGYVSDVTVDANNVTKSAKIIPIVDFSTLEYVMIIKELKEGLY